MCTAVVIIIHFQLYFAAFYCCSQQTATVRRGKKERREERKKHFFSSFLMLLLYYFWITSHFFCLSHFLHSIIHRFLFTLLFLFKKKKNGKRKNFNVTHLFRKFFLFFLYPFSFVLYKMRQLQYKTSTDNKKQKFSTIYFFVIWTTAKITKFY